MVSYEILLFFLVHMVTKSSSLNILGLATYDGNSHWFVMKSVFEVLIKAGHHVTVVAPYSMPDHENVTSIDVSSVLPPRRNHFTYELLMKEYYKPWKTLHVLPKLSLDQCAKIHTTDRVRDLINDSKKFDLVISEIFGADCDAVFAHLLHAPLISVIASTHLPWASGRVANPENPSFVSHILTPYSEKMNFPQRLINFVFHSYSYVVSKYYDRITTATTSQHFGDRIPSIDQIVQNTSLIFVNSHFSVDAPRPFVPNIIEIGGIHLPAAKKLPADILDILNNAKNGVIYFSLGSIIKASSLPNKTINAINSTFAELEFEVLWKFEDESINVPSNVHVKNWFPQRDILAHPKLKLAIIHGGLMSVFEAVDCGIPVLGVPLFFDQHRNIMNLVSKGMALTMEIDKITKERFKKNVRKLLDDERYKQNAVKLSERFNDRPLSPQNAVKYWSEYVANHNGAKHLRTAAADMSMYQILLLDVLVFLISIIFIFIYVSLRIFKLISSLFSHSHKQQMVRRHDRTHLKSS